MKPNPLDDLTLSSELALQVFFMREGFSEKESKALADRIFHQSNGEWPSTTRKTITPEHIKEILSLEIENIDKNISTLTEKIANLQEGKEALNKIVLSITERTIC